MTVSFESDRPELAASVANRHAQLYIERAGTGKITLEDNILYAESGQTYYQFEAGMGPSVFGAARNNLVYNAGPCPTWDAGCVNAFALPLGPGLSRLSHTSSTTDERRLQSQRS